MISFKRFITFLVISLVFFDVSSAEDQPVPSVYSVLEETDFEDAPQLACTTNDSVVMTAMNGVIDRRYRWRAFNVYMEESYNDDARRRVNNALYTLSRIIPCVRFGMWPRRSSPGGDYVHITNKKGCWSVVGRQGGKQELSLQNPGCMSTGTIIHEVLHALGFFHEQSRPDRDSHVNIHFENIIPGTEHNFNKYSPSFVTTFGVPYNQRSIMHYRATAFSKNGRPTITAKNGREVGSTGQLQSTDIRKLQIMYNCR